MADKKKDDLKYLQVPLPSEAKKAVTVRVNWSGLNRTQDLDTGELALERNISTSEAPALSPCPKPEEVMRNIDDPVGLWGFDDFLLLLCNTGGGEIGAYRIEETVDDEGHISYKTDVTTFPTEINEKGYKYSNKFANNFDVERSVVAMNLYKSASAENGGVVGGTYEKKLLVFPDRISMNFDAEDGKIWGSEIIPGNIMPNIRFATVHLSRLYGAAAPDAESEPDRVCVSGYNDYSNWNLDTDDDFSEAHAWYSAAQSNVRATGAFTGIATYLNSVVAFKKDYMHEITGSANPFRINDVFAEGAVNNRCIVEVDGTLFFVSDDAVKVYTGGNPRVMSYKLGIKKFINPAAGTDGRKYYLYCMDEGGSAHLFVYDTVVMEWAEEDAPDEVRAFAQTRHGLYALTRLVDGTGRITRLDTGNFAGQSWRAETDLSTALTGGRNTVDIKHVQKVQLLADMEPGSSLKAELIYNDVSGSKRTEKVFEKTNAENRVIRLPIRVVPRNTAHWGVRLALSGEGFVKIYHAQITAKAGGELYTTLRADTLPEEM